jgi:hypothetical protein
MGASQLQYQVVKKASTSDKYRDQEESLGEDCVVYLKLFAAAFPSHHNLLLG